MQPSNLYWQQLINGVVAQHQEEPMVSVAISLWERLAFHVISVVGEGGFSSLFSRSVFLTQSAFPWLNPVPPAPMMPASVIPASVTPAPVTKGFESLKKCLEAQTPTLAGTANTMLLTNFISTISSIIGDHLTMNIIRLAWGPELISYSKKEFINE